MTVNTAVLEEINADGFNPKQFQSSMNKKLDNIVIDLQKQTIKVPEVEQVEPDSIFHSNVRLLFCCAFRILLYLYIITFLIKCQLLF